MTIKEMRKAADMKQAAFADYIGVSLRTVQGWESNHPCPEYIRGLIEYKLLHENILGSLVILDCVANEQGGNYCGDLR